MSAISGYINQIRNAVYGEQVRTAIVNALEQCYSDVNAPSLQTEAFETALNEAYAGGILDIQTVTSFSAMTNQKIIYRYNGTAAGKQKGLYYFSALSDSWVLIGSEIQKVSLLSQMTDTNDIYKYIGTEAGMVQNSLYCYNGTAWVPIGSGVLTAATVAGMTNTGAIYKYTGTESGYVTNALYYYNGTAWVPISPPTDSTLQEEGKPADAYATGVAIARLRQNAGYLNSDAKTALITLLRNVAFIDQNGETYINNLVSALTPGGVPTVIKTITPDTPGYVKYGGFMATPPYKSPVKYRSTYELFDIPCVYGYKYTFDFESDVQTSYFVVMVFNENAVSAANSQQTISTSDYFDSGWLPTSEEYVYTPPISINNSPPAVVRVVAKMDNNDSTITADLWKSLTVIRSAL